MFIIIWQASWAGKMKLNPVHWLAAQAREMTLSCQLGITRCPARKHIFFSYKTHQSIQSELVYSVIAGAQGNGPLIIVINANFLLGALLGQGRYRKGVHGKNVTRSRDYDPNIICRLNWNFTVLQQRVVFVCFMQSGRKLSISDEFEASAFSVLCRSS